MEVFKSSERYECEELYRAREYNRVREYVAHKETYRSAEVNIQPEGSLPKADRKEQQQSRVRKKLLRAGSSFSAVGAAVGAVIIMAATMAEGRTVIRGAAAEPEIIDLQRFINMCGGKVSGAGTGRIPWAHRTWPLPTWMGETTTSSGARRSISRQTAVTSATASMVPTSWK